MPSCSRTDVEFEVVVWGAFDGLRRLVGGLDRRPKCWAIEHMAMNLAVSPARISGPLSLTANSSGSVAVGQVCMGAVEAGGDRR